MTEPPLDPEAKSQVEPRLPDPSAHEPTLIPEIQSEASHTPEPPMLDIHDAHHAASSWREFFIHIATIVLGLLIAIGLEQTVEYFHQRELAAHARETLTQEIDANHQLIQKNLYALRMHQAYLFQNLPVIQRARTHSLIASDRIVIWHPYSAFADVAWQSLHDSETASLLPYSELRQFARVYAIQDLFNNLLTESAVALQRANTVFYRSPADRFDTEKARNEHPTTDGFGNRGEAFAHAAFEQQTPGSDRIQQLTPAQLDRLEQAIQQGICDDDRLINFCTNLQAQYEAFAPADQQK